MSIISPMMQQYQDLKEQYSDCLLFFRLGDFYEMFMDDALLITKELSLQLTSRDSGGGNKVPMCGVPAKAVDNYAAKLTEKGYKLAICEQLEDAKKTKGLVKRGVVRIITPGTLVEENMLEEKTANYLAAISLKQAADGGRSFGLAYIDISSGEFMATEIAEPDSWHKLADEIFRINPAELILPAELIDEEFFKLRVKEHWQGMISPVYDQQFIKKNVRELLQIQFKLASGVALGYDEHKEAYLAAAYILHFLNHTQKRALNHIDSICYYNISEFLYIDAVSRRNLELTNSLRNGKKHGTLLQVIDNTVTAMGSRTLSAWLEKPLQQSSHVNMRLDAIDEMLDIPLVTADLRESLKQVYDIPRLLARICHGNPAPKDMAALKASLKLLPDIFRHLAQYQCHYLRFLLDELDLLEDIYQQIDDILSDEDLPVGVKEGNLLKSGYDAQVDELRDIAQNSRQRLLQLEASEKEKTGIRNLKIGFNKVFGYYIEVSKSQLDLVPNHYIRKQTIAGGERYITETLKIEEEKILTAKEKLIALEYEIFCKLRENVAICAPRIKYSAEILAYLDVLQGLAKTATDYNYCKPVVNDQAKIEIIEGRHPVVENIIGAENYMANDLLLDNDSQQLILITGPNMAGKSTYMRQAALIVILARIGSFVPASQAVIGHVDRIFTRVGASDDLASGQSTFMVEMAETSNILRHATKDSLVILDEIGRGTSTFDGLSIAWAVAEHLIQPKVAAKTLFATHYHELTSLADNFPLIKNYSVDVREKQGKIIFLYNIVEGGADKSYGIHVAALAGLPGSLLFRARQILGELEHEKRLQAKIASDQQISFADYLGVEENPAQQDVLEQILSVDCDSLTPIKALTLIAEWRKKLLE